MLSFFNFIPPFPLTFNNQYIALINFFFLFIFLFQYLDLFLTRVDGLRRRMASSSEEDLEYKIIRETFQVVYIYFQYIYAMLHLKVKLVQSFLQHKN